MGGVEANSVQNTDDSSWEFEIPAVRGSVKFKLDTGADVTVIGMKELIKFDKCDNDLLLTNRKLVGANKRPLNCAGYFVTKFV